MKGNGHFFCLVLLFLCFAFDVQAQTEETLYICKGQTYTAVQISSDKEFSFSDDQTKLTLNGVTYNVADIDSICFEQPTFMNDSVILIDGDTVNVVYKGTSAQVQIPEKYAGLVTASVVGAGVVLTSTAGDAELIYRLSGSSDVGSLVFNGSYKATFVLNGINLTSTSGAAIDIECGKRIAIELAEGTENFLTDASDGDQKACFYIKGHAEFSKGGSLTINGMTKHALATNEYCLIKGTTGNITIIGAKNDGIHVGQYFKMNGGAMNISGVTGDGIESEITSSTSDEDNGQLLIAGGTLNITTSGTAAKGLKCDSLLTISDGTITITQNGDKEIEGDDASYSTGIKTNGDIEITNGYITINNSADGGKGISADGNIHVTEGTVDIISSGAGGTYEAVDEEEEVNAPTTSYKVYVNIPTNGESTGGMRPGQQGTTTPYWSNLYLYKSDGTKVATLTKSEYVTSHTGETLLFYYYDFGTEISGTYYFAGDTYTSQSTRPGGSTTSYSIKSGSFSPPNGSDYYFAISESFTTSGTIRTFTLNNITSTYKDGTHNSSSTDGIVYSAAAIKADGNVTIDEGTLTIEHSGAMSKGINCDKVVTINGGKLTFITSGLTKVYNSDATYCVAIKTNDYVQTAGTITITASGAACRGISTDNTFKVSGGENIITCSGAGSIIGTSDSYAAKAYKTDGDMIITGGTHTLKCTGKGAKGIKINGAATFGSIDGTGPTMIVSTSGSYISTSGSGMEMGYIGSTKAIKVMGNITICGGNYNVTTATDGAEGIESKSLITINNGDIYVKAYDDCINCKGNIIFNGGRTYCYGTGNDAIDSNAGVSGAITINDGIVIGISTKGSPEEGLDCDNNSYILVKGGCIFSAGGSQGGSTSSTISGAAQGYTFLTTGISYTATRYYTLADASGNNIYTFKLPAAVSSSLSLISAPTMKSGSTYTIKYGTTVPTNTTSEFNGFYFGSSTVGNTQVTSFTAK